MNDIYSTLLSFGGIFPPKQRETGVNLHPILAGEASLDAQRPVFFHRRHYEQVRVDAAPPAMTGSDEIFPPIALEGHEYAVRSENWKLILNPATGTKTLFDIDRDPAEAKDVSGQNADVVTRLESTLSEWLAREQRIVSEDTVILDDDLEALKALGYLE